MASLPRVIGSAAARMISACKFAGAEPGCMMPSPPFCVVAAGGCVAGAKQHLPSTTPAPTPAAASARLSFSPGATIDSWLRVQRARLRSNYLSFSFAVLPSTAALPK
jgi:hypothetical protein